ncbi:hypothetical protein ANAEL_03015 [Anaerolineales bacterium]|nr:hypothetical protein ANAEL_03015 [Anaerolineales bacterium]
MSKQKRMIVLSFAVFLSLLAAAAMPLVVLAQDEIPPQPDTPVEVEDEPVVDESAVGESVAQPAPEETITEEVTIPEILEQLPEDTALVVVDEEGEALPLVSTEAAEVLAAPDPYFTAGGTTYRFLPSGADCSAYAAGTCFTSDTPIQDAVVYLSTTLNTKPDDGNIYVESGTYTENVFVDGFAWTTAGGDIPDYLGIIGAGSGVGGSTLTGSFSILGMNAFTLSGFTVNADSGDAIYVDGQEGALELADLEVIATMDEATGISVWSYHGDVDLTNVSSTTRGTGLRISADDGDVNLNGIDMSGNSFDGAVVDAWNGSLTVQQSNFSGNGGSGLFAGALAGDVTLSNATANGNSGSGAILSGYDITVNGGEFSKNGNGEGVGLFLFSFNNLTLNNVTATENEGSGFMGGGPGTATINGGNFSGNLFDGMDVFANGGVTLNHVTASDNMRSGALVDGDSINVLCGSYTGNDDYGLELDGNADLRGPILTGNTDGEYNLWSGTVTSGPCGKQVEAKSGEEGGERGYKPQNNLSGEPPVCNGEKKVLLGTGDGFGIFQNLCGLDFQLEEVKTGILPGVLPGGFVYIAGMDVGISSGEQVVEELPVGGKITLKFPIPTGADEASLAVLFWNGSTWVEVTGGKAVDGFYVIGVNQPGTYVLAS